MDLKLRSIEKIAKQGNLSKEELDKLEDQKNSIKLPYELEQQNFENFFSSYYIMVSFLLDQDRLDSQTSNILKSIQKYKNEILMVINEGIQNPVVASALHQHSEEYLTVIVYILQSLEAGEAGADQNSGKQGLEM